MPRIKKGLPSHGSTPIPPIGPRLKKARREAGISCQGLADRCGVSLRTLQELEGGRGAPPRIDLVWSIAQALSCSASYLAFGV